MMQVNAIGDACPVPVIKTKKALGELASGCLEVLVDNEIAVQNVRRYVGSVGCLSKMERQNDYFRILIEKPNAPRQPPAEPGGEPGDGAEQGRLRASAKTVAVLSSDAMGSGDDELGRILMKGFVFALTQSDAPPDTILLYNAGAKLSVSGSAALDDLMALEKAGVNILTCGTCLNHFGIADQLRVGEITNMYSIMEELRNADRILRP
jgi:selenium metabolism protein YedF